MIGDGLELRDFEALLALGIEDADLDEGRLVLQEALGEEAQCLLVLYEEGGTEELGLALEGIFLGL